MPNTPYFDPQTALPDPSVYTMHGPFGQQAPSFLGYQAAANRRETMAPFLQRAGQEDTLNLQKLQQDTSEYMSPSGMGQRLAGRQAATAQSQKTAANTPLEQQLQASQLGGQIASQPILNATQLEKARQELSTQKGQPSEHAMQIMANMYPAIKSAGSDIAKQLLHAEAVKRFQSKYPDEPIPANLKTWNPGMERMYQAASEVAVGTPEFRQKMAEGAQTQAGQTQRTGMEVSGRQQVTESTLAAGRTPEQTVNWAREQLRNKKLSPQQRQSIELQLDASHDQLAEAELKNRFTPSSVVDRAILESMARQKMDSGEMTAKQAAEWIETSQTRHQADIDSQKAKMRKSRGFTMSTLRNQPGSQGKTDAEIKAQAKARGITVLE